MGNEHSTPSRGHRSRSRSRHDYSPDDTATLPSPDNSDGNTLSSPESQTVDSPDSASRMDFDHFKSDAARLANEGARLAAGAIDRASGAAGGSKSRSRSSRRRGNASGMDELLDSMGGLCTSFGATVLGTEDAHRSSSSRRRSDRRGGGGRYDSDDDDDESDSDDGSRLTRDTRGTYAETYATYGESSYDGRGKPPVSPRRNRSGVSELTREYDDATYDSQDYTVDTHLTEEERFARGRKGGASPGRRSKYKGNSYDEDDNTFATYDDGTNATGGAAAGGPTASPGEHGTPAAGLKAPLASSFAKRCYFTKAGIGKVTQHYEGLTLSGNMVLMLASAMKLKGCPTICDEDLRRVEQTYPNQFSRLPDELLLSSGWRRISKYCHFSNRPIPDGIPFFHSKTRCHPQTGGYYFLLAAAVGMARPIDVEPLNPDTLVVLQTDYPQTCDGAAEAGGDAARLLEDPTQWTLVNRFCFFSGGPINTDEDVYYRATMDGNEIYMLAFLSPSLTPEELYRLGKRVVGADGSVTYQKMPSTGDNQEELASVDAVRKVESVYDLTDRDFADLRLYHLGPCRALPPELLSPEAWTKVVPPHFIAAKNEALRRAEECERRNGVIHSSPHMAQNAMPPGAASAMPLSPASAILGAMPQAAPGIQSPVYPQHQQHQPQPTQTAANVAYSNVIANADQSGRQDWRMSSSPQMNQSPAAQSPIFDPESFPDPFVNQRQQQLPQPQVASPPQQGYMAQQGQMHQQQHFQQPQPQLQHPQQQQQQQLPQNDFDIQQAFGTPFYAGAQTPITPQMHPPHPQSSPQPMHPFAQSPPQSMQPAVPDDEMARQIMREVEEEGAFSSTPGVEVPLDEALHLSREEPPEPPEPAAILKAEPPEPETKPKAEPPEPKTMPNVEQSPRVALEDPGEGDTTYYDDPSLMHLPMEPSEGGSEEQEEQEKDAEDGTSVESALWQGEDPPEADMPHDEFAGTDHEYEHDDMPDDEMSASRASTMQHSTISGAYSEDPSYYSDGGGRYSAVGDATTLSPQYEEDPSFDSRSHDISAGHSPGFSDEDGTNFGDEFTNGTSNFSPRSGEDDYYYEDGQERTTGSFVSGDEGLEVDVAYDDDYLSQDDDRTGSDVLSTEFDQGMVSPLASPAASQLSMGSRLSSSSAYAHQILMRKRQQRLNAPLDGAAAQGSLGEIYEENELDITPSDDVEPSFHSPGSDAGSFTTGSYTTDASSMISAEANPSARRALILQMAKARMKSGKKREEDGSTYNGDSDHNGAERSALSATFEEEEDDAEMPPSAGAMSVAAVGGDLD